MYKLCILRLRKILNQDIPNITPMCFGLLIILKNPYTPHEMSIVMTLHLNRYEGKQVSQLHLGRFLSSIVTIINMFNEMIIICMKGVQTYESHRDSES